MVWEIIDCNGLVVQSQGVQSHRILQKGELQKTDVSCYKWLPLVFWLVIISLVPNKKGFGGNQIFTLACDKPPNGVTVSGYGAGQLWVSS